MKTKKEPQKEDVVEADSVEEEAEAVVEVDSEAVVVSVAEVGAFYIFF